MFEINYLCFYSGLYHRLSDPYSSDEAVRGGSCIGDGALSVGGSPIGSIFRRPVPELVLGDSVLRYVKGSK